MENRLRICVITSPRPRGGIIPVSNLIDILSNFCGSLYLITGNEGDAVCRSHRDIHSYSITYKPGKLLLTRIIKYIILQLKISYELLKLIKKVDLYIFFMGEGLMLPVLVGRILGKSVVACLASSAARKAETSKDILSRPFKFLEALNYLLSNRIVLYTPSLIKEWNLERYGDKISIAREHFLDFDKFKLEKPLTERDNLVGYIGRFSQEKGILNFIEAIPKVVETGDEAAFLIGGDGQLRGRVAEHADESGNKAKFVGWIPHGELPKHLNELKLLVLPSYTEGLPNIMLEAMACGTPVLATPVGGIPDVIKDGETGLIMENNSPECIAKNIVMALNHPGLEQIARNARALVEREFTFEKAAESYKNILHAVSM